MMSLFYLDNKIGVVNVNQIQLVLIILVSSGKTVRLSVWLCFISSSVCVFNVIAESETGFYSSRHS